MPSPFDCYMALRGLKTLHVRMERHASNAMALAKYLEAHAMVEKVIYPGLPSHKQHAIAKAQMHGFGAMITFYVKGDLEGARAFLENLSVFTLAESLGAVESLAESPYVPFEACRCVPMRWLTCVARIQCYHDPRVCAEGASRGAGHRRQPHPPVGWHRAHRRHLG